MKTGKKLRDLAVQGILHGIMLILLVLLLYPLFISVWISFKDLDLFRNAPWIPTLPLWLSNYSVAWKEIYRYIFNTVFVAVCATTGMLLLSSISAYVFARLKFPGKEQIYFAIIALMMVPGVLTLVPTYMTYNYLGMLDSYLVLIVPVIIGGSVGGIFLLRSFFSGIPEELFEAARIDGSGELQAYWHVCLPLSKPILGTLAISTIIGIWNDIVWPMITISKQELWTISVGLFLKFSDQYATNVPVSFSGYMLSSIPLIILFATANKYYIEGLTSAGLKL